MDSRRYFGARKPGMTASMMLVIVGIILAIIMIVIFFPATLNVADFVYSFGCETWTTLMNAVYEVLSMPPATAAC